MERSYIKKTIQFNDQNKINCKRANNDLKTLHRKLKIWAARTGDWKPGVNLGSPEVTDNQWNWIRLRWYHCYQPLKMYKIESDTGDMTKPNVNGKDKVYTNVNDRSDMYEYRKV